MPIPTRLLSSIGAVGAAVAMAACSTSPQPVYPQGGGYPQGGYPSGGDPQQGQGNYAQFGRVTNVEYLRGGQSQGVAGAVVGGAVGGLAGHQIGGGSGRTAATVLGVVGGALIGRAIEQNTNRGGQDFYRVTVQMDNGGVRTFDYGQAPDVRIGERVRADGNQLFR